MYTRTSTRQTLTPSKIDKYNQYTPRKRYVKEQQQFNQYQSLTFGDVSSQGPTEESYLPRSRYLGSSRRQVCRQSEEPVIPLYKSRQISRHDVFTPQELPDVLEDITYVANSRPSFRQQRLKKNAGEKQLFRRAIYDENNNGSNIRAKTHKYMEEEPLTPRKVTKLEEKDNNITEKMSALQHKIARLERMTPKRSATPTNKRQYNESCSSYDQSRIIFDKEETKPEATSQVTAISERQSQILSGVSLGRLVEEQEGESQIEMIQDLSYKISCKLKSIIRNFG